MKHKHRRIPGHQGGKYDSGNVVICDNSVCDREVAIHPMWHFANWQLYGKIEDYLAWRGLTGMIGKEEIIRQVQAETCRKVGKANKGKNKDNSDIGCFGTEKKKQWWDERPDLKQKRSSSAGKANKKSLWIDPDHPELGAKPAYILAAQQKLRGLPHGPENRVKMS